jgi:RNA polymerase sigma-70 factor, ECF subfamily
MDKEKSDNELMSEFKGCSEYAYEKIFNRYKIRIFNYIYWSIIKDDFLSEEVTQETLIKVWEYKFLYQPKYRFSTWVFTVARNLAIDKIRDINKRKGIISGSEKITNDANPYALIQTSSNILNEIEINDRNDKITDIIMSLDQKYSEVIILRYIEDLSFKEISVITGKNVSTLKTLAKRGIGLIRKQKGIKDLE